MLAHHPDLLEARLREEGQQLLLDRGAHHALHPQPRVLVAVHRHRTMDNHVGELQSSARPEHPEHLRHGAALVRHQVEGAVAGDAVDAGIGQRQLLGGPLHDVEVVDAGPVCRGEQPASHGGGEVEGDHPALGAGQLAGDQGVIAGTGADVEHPVSGLNGPGAKGVADAGEAGQGLIGQVASQRRGVA